FLHSFVNNHHSAASLSDLAHNLAESLNRFVPPTLQRNDRSGIHLAGITSKAGVPEFWFVRNVDDNGDPTLGRYEAREDYLRRDARANGFDGTDAKTLPSVSRLYRNGDIVSHVAAWESLDDSLGKLLNISQFHPIRTPDKYAE